MHEVLHCLQQVVVDLVLAFAPLAVFCGIPAVADRDDRCIVLVHEPVLVDDRVLSVPDA